MSTLDGLNRFTAKLAQDVAELAGEVRDLKQAAADRESAAEDQYLIERLSRLLAEIALAVYGPQPQGTSWGYDQLPARVAALKAQAEQAQGSPNA
jgi:hypothetical protein